jgi:hypothetical protein
MPIKFNCGKCGQELNVKDEMAGKQGKCPGCKAVVNVPTSSAPKSSVTTSVRKKSDDVVEAAEFVDDEEDERPRKKSRRDDDDDDDDRPRKKSRRDDDDDDDDDDRPRKKKSRDDDDDDDGIVRKKSRDDDDDDDYDGGRPMNPKLKRARLQRAATGVGLASIGMWVTAGALGLSALLALIFGAMSGSRGGAGMMAMGDIINILGWLTALAMVAGVILRVVGSALILMTPGRSGELAFGIACVSTSALAALFVLIMVIKLFDFPSGYGGLIAWFLPVAEYHPLSGVGGARIGLPGLGVGIDLGFTVYIVPILEIAWAVLFSLYIWSVGKSNKDRATRSKGMLMVIIQPSVLFGASLLFFLLFKIRINSAFIYMMFLTMHALVIGGTLIFLIMMSGAAKWTLRRAR